MGDYLHVLSCVMSNYNHSCMQKNGRDIAWRHIVALYYRDRGKASGLAMVQKLKYEHIYLSSFSKMRVDLAAQVDYFTNNACMHCITHDMYY